MEMTTKTERRPRINKINGTNLEDAWRQALYAVMEFGRKYLITGGSFSDEHRLTLPMLIEILYPGTRPLAPIMPAGFNMPPTTEEKIEEYFESLINPGKMPDEHYTYGEDLWWQVEEVIRYFKKHGHGTACCHMVVGRPESILFYNREVDLVENIAVRDRETQEIIWQRRITNLWNSDPKIEVSSQCLRGIDVWIGDGMMNFWIYFRSWDLFGGFPQNLGGLQRLKEYMSVAVGVDDGQMVVCGKDIHIYEHAWDAAKKLMKKM